MYHDTNVDIAVADVGYNGDIFMKKPINKSLTQKISNILATLYVFIGSKWFFGSFITLFILQAAWLAWSMGYPQAFDEQYHLGIIQFFSHQLSPFIGSQPTSADQYGPLLRTPSYLYHYLLSFPYRVITHFTDSQMAVIIAFRFLGIAMFTSGLFVFKRLLQTIGISKQLTNMSLAFVAFLPVMPLLAAQLNYDNLLFPMTGLCFLLAHKILTRIKVDRTLPLQSTVWFLTLGMLTSLVKYPFVPIFAALFIIIVIAIARQVRSWPDWKQLVAKRFTNWLLIALAIVSLGLFFEKYGLNMLHYHTPIPECDQVLSIDRCQEYGPWARNFHAKDWNVQLTTGDIVGYPYVWTKHIMWELIFAVSSYYDASGAISYHAGQQFIVVQFIIWTVFGLAVLLLLLFGRWLWRQENLRPLLITSMVYVLALFAQNYWDYLQIGVAYAMHGRYLLPVLPLLFAAIGLLVARAIASWPVVAKNQRDIKVLLASFTLVLLLTQGGGYTTFVLRSQSTWLRPDSSVQSANNTLKNILRPTVIDVQPQDK